jgi:ActR/RegA family two-component response regulator
LDWRSKVELFERIRREYEFGIGTIAGVAKKLGVHRRMVGFPLFRKRTAMSESPRAFSA